MTSESKLGIIDPYDYQCDFIDAMIEKSNESVKFCESAILAMDSQTIVQANKETLARIKHFPEQLEEFRTAIEEVREWGQQWKNLAKTLLHDHEPTRLNPAIEFDPDIPF